MKNYLNKIMLAALVLLSSFHTGQAAVATFSATGASTNVPVTGPGAINLLSLSAATNAAANWYLYDSSSTTLTNILAPYTNYTPSIYTNVTYYTNVMDMWVSNGVSVFGANAYITNLYYYLTNLAVDPQGRATLGLKVTNTARLLGQWTVPAGTTISVPLVTPITFTRGIAVSNDQPASLTIQYQPFK